MSMYRWCNKYVDVSASEVRRLGDLDAENRRPKHVVAEQASDNAALEAMLREKW